MLDFIVETAQLAGKEAMLHFGKLKENEVSSKGAVRDLVSVADKAVEALIVSRIKERFPEHENFGEESGRTGDSAEYCWVIDPIDGTQNFVKNIPVFSVSIGLRQKGEYVAGCVHQPALGTTFYAEKGKGAFENGKRIRVSDCDNIEHAVCATGFACLRAGLEHNHLPYFNKLAPIIRSVLRTGSAAYDLCLVASGRLDGYWEFALQEYDIAAGTIIAREAGAIVTDHRDKNNFPADGILCTTPGLHEQFLAYLN